MPLKGDVSSNVSGRSYKRGVFAAGQRFGNDSRKAAGDNSCQVRTINRYDMRRRTMDFAAFFGGSVGAVIMLRHVHVGRRGSVFVTILVVGGSLGREIHPCIAMKAGGVRDGEKARLERRHYEEHDRKHRTERYNSSDRDSTKFPHHAFRQLFA
jgi:hypothetical protein